MRSVRNFWVHCADNRNRRFRVVPKTQYRINCHAVNRSEYNRLEKEMADCLGRAMLGGAGWTYRLFANKEEITSEGLDHYFDFNNNGRLESEDWDKLPLKKGAYHFESSGPEGDLELVAQSQL